MALAEQIAIAGALSPDLLNDAAQASQAAAYIAKRMDQLSAQHERGWRGESDGAGGLRFERTLRGVTSRFRLEAALVRSPEARRLDEKAAEFQREKSLGWFRKASLGNDFRWKLKDLGYSDAFIDIATEGLMVYISRTAAKDAKA